MDTLRAFLQQSAAFPLPRGAQLKQGMDLPSPAAPTPALGGHTALGRGFAQQSERANDS